jgi:hypothetical protein
MSVLHKFLAQIRKLQKHNGPSKRYDDLEKLIRYFDTTSNAARILYFGDSVVERVSDLDKDKRTLSEMLADALREKMSLVCVSHSAYNMKVYFGLASALRRMQSKPRVVILPINLRSFSPQWDLEPSWQFESQLQCLREYAENGSVTLNDHKETLASRYEEFDSTPVFYPLSPLQQVGQFRLLIAGKPASEMQKRFRSSQIFIFHYLYRLEHSHPKLEMLKETINLLLNLGIKVLVYVTPVNYVAGERYVGKPFVSSLNENRSVVTRILEPFLTGSQVKYKDYSQLLADDCFFHENSPTEHLNQTGRTKLVTELVNDVLGLDCDVC